MEHWIKGLVGVALILGGGFYGYSQLVTHFLTFAVFVFSVAVVYGGWHLTIAAIKGK